MLLRFNYPVGKVISYQAKSNTVRQISKSIEVIDTSRLVYFSDIKLKTIAKDEEGFHIRVRVSNRQPDEKIDEEIKTVIIPVGNQTVYMVVDELGNIIDSAGSQEVSTLVFPDYDIQIGEYWNSTIKFNLPGYNKHMDISISYVVKEVKDNIFYIEGRSNESSASIPIDMESITGQKQTLQGNFVVTINSYFEFDNSLGTNRLQEIYIDTIIKVEDYVMENNVHNVVKIVN
ncbi:MAG: hypothetical protein RMJ51_04355 [Candidatus Calescibacterium sp.]|nr:hypothetical protein [Candidatus Calescibacterium sp.]MCX7971962.1 hypothetical protein [bacterium]MDW8195452.1 hypothetical protein [Candidatus Calescibacterium sp.]